MFLRHQQSLKTLSMSKTEVLVVVSGLFSIVASSLLSVFMFSLLMPAYFEGINLHENLIYLEDEIKKQLMKKHIDVDVHNISFGVKIGLTLSCLIFFLESLLLITGVKTKVKKFQWRHMICIFLSRLRSWCCPGSVILCLSWLFYQQYCLWSAPVSLKLQLLYQVNITDMMPAK